MPDINQHDPTFFPVFTGLDKPVVSAKPPVQKIGLSLPGKTSGKTVVSASPLHGVTRLSLIVGKQVSETYNNGKGDSTKVGKYFAPVTEVLAFNPEVDKPKICWKARNTANFTSIKFELFRQGDSTPIWSLSWDKAQTQTNILRGGLDAGSKSQDGQTIPIHWSGSLEWVDAVVLDKGLFPNGRLTIEHSPYQLRMTANNNDPGPGKMGYPLIAWTYFMVTDEIIADEETAVLINILYEAALAGIPFCEGLESLKSV